MDFPFLSSHNLSSHHLYCDTLHKELLIRGRDLQIESILASHDIYFQSFSQTAQKVPIFAKRLVITGWRNLNEFYIEMMNEALNLEDQGFVYLVLNRGCLEICCLEYWEMVIRRGCVPLLALDLWEHAYYLDYQNEKERYVRKFCEHIDWGKVIYRVNMGRNLYSKI